MSDTVLVDCSDSLTSAPRSDPRDRFRGSSESRRRSRSPRRDEKLYEQRRPSPPRRGTPVYIVDVRKMYATLRCCVAESAGPLTTVATELGLPCDDKSMCAGNESR